MTCLPLIVECGICYMSKKELTAIKANDKKRKSEKPKTLAGITESIDPQEGRNISISKASRDKVESSEGSGMETDQLEQLDTLLNQPVKVLK